VNRRNFLKCLGLVAAATATPKFIFDVGANTHKYQHLSLNYILNENSGIILMYAGNTPPPGYMICDGRELSKISHPNLHEILKYSYGGVGDKFNLPDCRSRFG
jgi:hypothetical protein